MNKSINLGFIQTPEFDMAFQRALKEVGDYALEMAAQRIEVMSLSGEFNDCFNQSKPGCAAILADEIRKMKQLEHK